VSQGADRANPGDYDAWTASTILIIFHIYLTCESCQLFSFSFSAR
jgi:hypothetical protein